MPYILGFIALLAAGAFWFYRLKNIGQATNEVVDAAQTARGAWNRWRFRQKVEGSAITAINDPAIGAAVMMFAVCLERGPLQPHTLAMIQQELREIIGGDPTEAFTYAKWAVDQVVDPSDVSRKLAPLWMQRLEPDERWHLLAMVERVAGAEGALTPRQQKILQKLQERLSLART